MSKVYKLKYKVKDKDLEELGYLEMPIEISGKDKIIYKPISVPEDSQAVRAIIEIYNNKEWQKVFLFDENSRLYFKEIGIDFEDIYDDSINSTKTVVKETPELIKKIASDFRIEVEMNKEKWVGFTAGVGDELPGFYNKSVLDQYCPNEIKELFDNGLVVIKEVKDK